MTVTIIRRVVNGHPLGLVLDLPDDEAKALICSGTAEVTTEKPALGPGPTQEEAPAPETVLVPKAPKAPKPPKQKKK